MHISLVYEISRNLLVIAEIQLTLNDGNNNNELDLHDYKRELQHCKLILLNNNKKSKSNNNLKLSIINCLVFLNRMIRIVLTA